MVGRQAHRAAAGRADRRRHRAAARRLAGLRQGRRAQRDGHRHRRRLPRRRPAGALGAPRPRLGGADDRAGAEAEAFAAAAVDWDAGAVGDDDVVRFGELAAAASAGRSTTTGRPRPTAATPSRCSPAGCCGGRSRTVDGELSTTRCTSTARRHEVADAWLGESLLYVLRERLGLLGAKGACEQGECGSCSVLVDGELVCSCLVLAASAVDVPIVTIEGLAEPGAPTDVQRAFVDAGAVQCGFCTPGLVMAAHALLERIPQPTRHRDPRGAVRQHLPLHRLRPDHRRGAAGRRRRGRARAMTRH